MPILRDFERRLEGLIEGLFAKTFRSGLQPVELAKRILKDMDAGKTVTLKETWAPNHFVFSLSPPDGARFEQAEGALVSELEQVIRDAAGERGWGLVGPPHVEFEFDDDLKKGEFRCAATLVEGDREHPLPPEVSRASLVLLENDRPARTFNLGKEVVTLGRLPGCDVVVPDPGASRRHAQIRLADGGFVLADLGSTNGTEVNGVVVQERRLEDGDRITIGTSVLEFRRG